MRISDWSSDVCSSDLATRLTVATAGRRAESRPDGSEMSATESRLNAVATGKRRPSRTSSRSSSSQGRRLLGSLMVVRKSVEVGTGVLYRVDLGVLRILKTRIHH